MTPGPILLDELDAFIAQADALGMQSHAQRNAFLASRTLAYEASPELSPFSAAYATHVEKIWRTVAARRHYSVLLEHDPNVRADQNQLANLYPFISRDTRFIGEYWMGVYFALKLFDDAPARSVLEYGVGWGNATMALLQSGFNVVAVDVDPKWLGLLEMRAQRVGLDAELQTLHGVFGDLPAGDALVGGVLFYECFPHALAHDDALGRIVPRLMPGGSIVFAGEPVLRDFPIPWGVRLDGHSLWEIRFFGWMELGFNEDYFIALLRRHNLSVQRHICPQAGTPGVAYKATRRADGFSLAHSMLSSGESGFLAPEADPAITTIHKRRCLPPLAAGQDRQDAGCLQKLAAPGTDVNCRSQWQGPHPDGSACFRKLPAQRAAHSGCVHRHRAHQKQLILAPGTGHQRRYPAAWHRGGFHRAVRVAVLPASVRLIQSLQAMQKVFI